MISTSDLALQSIGGVELPQKADTHFIQNLRGFGLKLGKK